MKPARITCLVVLTVFATACEGALPTAQDTSAVRSELETAAWDGDTRLHMSEAESLVEAGSLSTSQDLAALSSEPATLFAQVSVFYPAHGESRSGRCWMGLRIDSDGNVYPNNDSGYDSGVYRIRPDGIMINGVNDQNLFATGTSSYWVELDEPGGTFYSASSQVRSAPFVEGSSFSALISGVGNGRAITLGRGPLAGNLYATDFNGRRVVQVALSPLGLSTFASGSLLPSPDAVASAPDGSLYVANLLSNPSPLTKISPDGTASTFATALSWRGARAVIVDDDGNVYWSRRAGINKYDSNGVLLGTLPGPLDQWEFGNLMGSAFDSEGNLYFVDNYGCKKIYKYRFITPAEALQDLIAQVLELVETGAIDEGQATALTSILEAAYTQVDRDNPAASKQLGAFLDLVDAFVMGGSLTGAEAKPLLDAAQAILDWIGG